MSFKVLRLTKVMEITGLGRSTIYAKVAKGQFPSSIKLGDRAVGWLENDIETWIKKRRHASLTTQNPTFQEGKG